MRKKLLRALVILSLLALVPVAWYFYRAWADAKDLADVIADLDQTAPGWRMAELEARRAETPAAQNSANLLRAAKLPTPRTWDFQLDDCKLQPNQSLTPLQAAKLRDFLDQLEPNLLEARRLVSFPAGRFAVTIAPDFISTLLPHVQEARDVNHLLFNDAVWHAHQANFDRVIEDMHAARNASRALRGEPFLISHLVRLAMLNECAQMLERTLAQGQPPSKLLEEAQRLLAEEDPVADAWFDGIEGERAGMHGMFQHFEKQGMNMHFVGGLSGARRGRLPGAVDSVVAGLTLKQSHAWVLRNFTAQLAARALPPQDRRATLNELFAWADEAPEVAKMLMSNHWRRSYETFLGTEAKLRAAGAGLAAERFRQKHDRWPKALDELLPAWLAKVPVDPFNGEPLRYRIAKDGIVIHAAGPEDKYQGDSRDAPEPPVRPGNMGEDFPPSYEFRLWNVDQRRRPGRDL